jgi:hypothetical protein
VTILVRAGCRRNDTPPEREAEKLAVRARPFAADEHLTAREPEDAVGGEGRMVGGDDDGRAIRGRLLEKAHHHLRVVVVDRRERLVRQEDPWPSRQCSGDRDPLPFPGRKLVRIGAAPVAQPESFERVQRPALDRSVRDLGIAYLHCEDEVFEGGQAREQALVLVNERHLAADSAETAPPPPMEASPLDPNLSSIRP